MEEGARGEEGGGDAFFMLSTMPLYLQSVSGGVAQSVELRTGTPLTQVQFPSAARDASLKVSFQCRLFYGIRTPPCSITCINICEHV